MNVKKPPQMTPLPLSTFVLHKGRHEIDQTYQQEPIEETSVYFHCSHTSEGGDCRVRAQAVNDSISAYINHVQVNAAV